jgi:hypothetical protein
VLFFVRISIDALRKRCRAGFGRGVQRLFRVKEHDYPAFSIGNINVPKYN